MIPASHLLSGFLAGRAARWAAGAPPPRNPWLDAVVLTAIGGAVFPDWDVIPGLVFVAATADLHRGPTHSLPGILLQAPLIALGIHFVWKRLFHEAPPVRALFWPALAGLATHVFWDSLNPWGVTLFWPLGDKTHANLIHEGDLFVLGALILSSVVVAAGYDRVGFSLCLTLILGYALFQWQWKSRIEERAEQELSGEFVRTYPNGQVDCPWLVLARLPDTLQAYCASTPLSGERRLILEEPILRDERIEASSHLANIVEFNKYRDFAFTELQQHPDGSATVIWRDLRESVFETTSEQPSGYYVRFSADGRVVGVDRKWFLRIWFW